MAVPSSRPPSRSLPAPSFLLPVHSRPINRTCSCCFSSVAFATEEPEGDTAAEAAEAAAGEPLAFFLLLDLLESDEAVDRCVTC